MINARAGVRYNELVASEAPPLKRKILMNPGSIYSDGPNRYIRISYAYAPLDALKEGIRILGEQIRSFL
jgi:GntR family transcriptional regulator of abcA and norABC